MREDKITAFPDGNSFSHYSSSSRLIIGNSEGLIKIFNTDEPDLEPQSIDILENLTSIASHGNELAVASTSGNLELIDLSTNTNKGTIYRSELPLRDCLFINEGKRIVCGGDVNKLAIIDMENDKLSTEINLPDQLVNLSYNFTGELLTISLSNGDAQIYSVINELPNLIKTLSNVLPNKIHLSMDKIDFKGEHNDELIGTITQWSSNGKYCLFANSNSIQVYDRSDWSTPIKTFEVDEKIIDFKLSSNLKYLAVLTIGSQFQIIDFNSKVEVLTKYFDLDGEVPINLVWEEDLIIGTSNGEVLRFKEVVDSSEDAVSGLFLEEAEEDSNFGDTDIEDVKPKVFAYHEEDSLVIDADDDDEDIFRKPDDEFDRRIKRSKPNAAVPHIPKETLIPYSPGSTPWSLQISRDTANADRRYLFMNSVGYAWAVKSNENLGQQSITVSFFDRSIHKDYHFTDYFSYDLCSINATGILLSYSGFNDTANGKIYYRSHDSEQDSWESPIPLLKNEFITSVSLTHVPYEAGATNINSLIVVGTSVGYLRIFNLYGVCVNIIKTLPIVTLISSVNSVLFFINEVNHNSYTFSIIDINQDYKFIQQNVLLPLKISKDPNAPLIKGLFFNEYNDPCFVSGYDDTVMILQSWRETNNSKWIPILNCTDIITEYGTNSNKKNWRCWPLGLYRDQLNCLILKNNNHYPGFPLPLPIELEIKLPVYVHQPKKKKSENDLFDDDGEDQEVVNKENPEEIFLRALTMGRLANDSLNDESIEGEQDNIMKRLTEYSIMFDKSLLMMFGEACKESKLNRALSIAKLIKTDKALAAASKISERMLYVNLASKISKLREDLIELSDDE